MGLVKLIDLMSTVLGGFTKKSLADYCFLETAEGNILVGKDGSMGTIVKIDGIKGFNGEDELNEIIDTLSISLSSFLTVNGRALQVYFARDPDKSLEYVDKRIQLSRNTAESVGLSLDDLFEERRKVWSKNIVAEDFYFVLWTRMTVLAPDDYKEVVDMMKPPSIFPKFTDTQNIYNITSKVKSSHTSFVESVCSALKSVEMRYEIVDAKNALALIRESIYPDQAATNWKPVLPEDKITISGIPKDKNDISWLLAPRIEDQLFTQGAEWLNSRICRMGGHYFGSTDMTVGPQRLISFNNLISSIIDRGEFPWRVSFLIEGNAMAGTGFKQFLATIAKPLSDDNKMLSMAYDRLNNIKEQGGNLVQLRVSFATWAKVDNSGSLQEINKRLSKLQDVIKNWGFCQVSEMCGDSIEGVFSSVLGLSPTSAAPVGQAPILNAFGMLPLLRDSSPFKNGSVLFRTVDKKPFDFESGSSVQNSSCDIIIAPPGFGKSVLLNTTNLSFVLSPKGTQSSSGPALPRISIIDIGSSSSGLISLLKEALPPSQKYLVESRKLEMTAENSINPFDLQLGQREPMQNEISFLVNFISLLVTPIGGKIPEGMNELISIVIPDIYRKFSDISDDDSSDPREYEAGTDYYVDDMIKKCGIVLSNNQTWYGLMDKFFDKGQEKAATHCQRQAVPRFDDLAGMRTDRIKNLFEKSKTQNGEFLIDKFNQAITIALEKYPILTKTTQFELGNAQIVSLDLEPSSPQGGQDAERQTSLVYMLARYVLARDYYYKPEYADLFPERYRDYQRTRFERLFETPKKLIFDEFHRTASAISVREQVERDIREGRKYNVHIAIASQSLSDVNEQIMELATGVWLLGFNSKKSIEEASKKFDLTNSAKNVLKTLKGPGPGGAPFLVVLTTKDGQHQHFLFNTLGPIELWGFSTTAEDTTLRKKLYDLLGGQEARRRLAKRFPQGSAKSDIEARTQEQLSKGFKRDQAQEGVISQLVDEIMRNG